VGPIKDAVTSSSKEPGKNLTDFKAGQRRNHAVQRDHSGRRSADSTQVTAALLLGALIVGEVLLADEYRIEHARAVQAAAPRAQNTHLPSCLNCPLRRNDINSKIHHRQQVLLRNLG